MHEPLAKNSSMSQSYFLSYIGFARTVFLALALATIAAGAAGAQSITDRFTPGINYNFFQLSIGEMDKCLVRNTATIESNAFLTRYDNEDVRRKVLDHLSIMRQNGFRIIRTLVWFSGLHNPPSNSFHLLRDRARAKALIAKLEQDIADAGYEEWYVSFGGIGPAGPSCRKQEWGDCFEKDSISASIEFILEVRSGLTGAGLKLFVDLSNEGCMWPDAPPIARKNWESYHDKLVPAYRFKFPDDVITISCILRSDRPNINYVIDKIARDHPRDKSYLEFHTSKMNYRELKWLTDSLKLAAPKVGKIVIGESRISNVHEVEAWLNAMSRAGVNQPAILFWPAAQNNKCHAEIAPPYDLKWLQ